MESEGNITLHKAKKGNMQDLYFEKYANITENNEKLMTEDGFKKATFELMSEFEEYVKKRILEDYVVTKKSDLKKVGMFNEGI